MERWVALKFLHARPFSMEEIVRCGLQAADGLGYAHLARNGRDGMRLATEESPHLLLLDVMPPGLNGFDVCRQLRHTGFGAPIILVTGRTVEVERVVGLELGADDYLLKPYSQRDLLARIRGRLRRKFAARPSSRSFAAA